MNINSFQTFLNKFKPWIFAVGVILAILALIFYGNSAGKTDNGGSTNSTNTGNPTEIISSTYKSLTEIKPLPSKYNFLIEGSLNDGTNVLNVPVNRLTDPFYADFLSAVSPLELTNISTSGYSQTFLYTSKTGLKPLSSTVSELHDFTYKNTTYWIYIDGGNVWVSEPNFVNKFMLNTSQFKLFKNIYSFGNQEQFFLEYNTADSKSKILFKTSDIETLFVQKTTFGDSKIKDAVTNIDYKMTKKPPFSVEVNGTTELQNEDYYYMGGGNFLVKTVSFAERFWRWNVYENTLTLLADFPVDTAGQGNSIVTCSEEKTTCFVYFYTKNKVYSFSNNQTDSTKLAVEKSEINKTFTKLDINTLSKLTNYHLDKNLYFSTSKGALIFNYFGEENILLK